MRLTKKYQALLKVKLESSIHEVQTHLQRMQQAFSALELLHTFPLSTTAFETILTTPSQLSYADQIIYRFSKAQDTLGGKLFKAYLEYQGENTDKPFLDILSALEKINILSIDAWFELREIRNEIAHEYDESDGHGQAVLNLIYQHKDEMGQILGMVQG